jgi:hypothetical protein
MARVSNRKAKATGKETLTVEPNTIPWREPGTASLINFRGEGYEVGLDYEIRYLDFVLMSRADEQGVIDWSINASGIPEEDLGKIEATVNARGDEPPVKILAKCSFTVVA